MMYTYIDIHSHIADDYFNDDRDAVIARMQEAGVATITIGTDSITSSKAVACAHTYENVWACVGTHPDEGHDLDPALLEELAQDERVVAIGECGLDYFRADDIKRTYEQQLPLFEAQMHIAAAHNLPLMLHVRPSRGSVDAYDDVLDILANKSREYGEKLRGNAHFFAGSLEQAKRFLDLGITLSFTGVITFALQYDEVIEMAPLSMLHAETDAPFVAPKPYRGSRCEPQYMIEVVKRIAQIKGEEEEMVRDQLRQNCQKLFGI